MMRQKSIFFALVIAGLWLPVQAEATTYSSVQSTFVGSATASRMIARALPGKNLSPYKVEVLGKSSVTIKVFTSLKQAEAYVATQQNAVLLKTDSGIVLRTTMREPFEALVYTLPGASPSTLAATLYSSLGAAETALANTPEATVIDRISGAVLWSNADNYAVLVQSGTALYENSLQDAESAATTAGPSTIENLATGKTVWSSIPVYNVFENGVLVKQFPDLASALAYTKAMANVQVVLIATGKTVYTNVADYLVEVGTKVIKSFVTEADAITYAKTLSGSVVVDLTDNKIVYSTAGAYGVYRYLQLVRSFTSLSDAITYAKTLSDVQVIETATRQVDYSNYPTQVRSPYGDTFTVVNGEVVDTWGNSEFVLAPAPAFMKTGQEYVSSDYSHWYEVHSTGDVYVGQWENPYQTMNLETRSTLTAAQINAFLANNAIASSVLQNAGAYFIEAQNTYGVNAEYLVAHAIIESAWGTSYFGEDRNNLFGYEAYTSDPNAAASFRSVEYDINFQAWFVRNDYLSVNGSFYNGPNLDGMNVDYATDPYWANSIARRMSQIETYTASLSEQPLLQEGSTRKVFPYPVGAKGMTTGATPLLNFPADSTNGTPKTLSTIPDNVLLSVYGDSPGWDKVSTSTGMSGFVNWNSISLQNMLEVKGIGYGNVLNIRSTPYASSSANIVDTVPGNVYLVLLGAGPAGWDKVVDDNGKEGYVSTQYVEVIH